MAKFSASVSKWVQKTEARMKAVRDHAAQTVADEVKKPVSKGGHMPIDTGYLRASLMASTSQMPSIDQNAKPISASAGENAGNSEIALVIAGAAINEPIYLGFTAAYARRMEYGFKGTDSLGRVYDQEGFGFVRLTAQRWQEIVRESAAIIKSRVQSR